MNYETLIVLTIAWLSIGLIGFRWATIVAFRENSKLTEDNARLLEESSLQQVALSRKLEATHAEVLSLRSECAALKGRLHGAIQ